jgi:ribosomal protein L16 Arg81 hydroxylase
MDKNDIEEYLKKLRNIRNALLEDNEELADNFRLELDDIVEKNMIEVDYVYEVNESSRRNAKDFLKLLRIDQLSSLISFNSDEFQPPLRALMNAVRELPDLAKDERIREIWPTNLGYMCGMYSIIRSRILKPRRGNE